MPFRDFTETTPLLVDNRAIVSNKILVSVLTLSQHNLTLLTKFAKYKPITLSSGNLSNSFLSIAVMFERGYKSLESFCSKGRFNDTRDDTRSWTCKVFPTWGHPQPMFSRNISCGGQQNGKTLISIVSGVNLLYTSMMIDERDRCKPLRKYI